MFRIRSFQRRVFVAILAVALLPAGLTVLTGTFVLREMVATAGTAGPWDEVARSGRVLLERAGEVASEGSELEAAVEAHRETLAESTRLSRLYAFVSDRFLRVLPAFSVGLFLLVGVLALLAARWLSRSFSRPIEELVSWTGLIARGEPLPPPADEEERGVREFERLRSALRTMAVELAESRARELESARLRTWTDMARGVAHELKNPLTPMRMAATTVSRLDDPAAADAASVLLEEIDRLDDMARSFSQLGRMPEGPPSEVDVEELLAGLVEMHDSHRVDVTLRVPDDLPLIRGHPEPLGRAIRNLVVNAVEAVEAMEAGTGGGVEVEARAIDGEEPLAAGRGQSLAAGRDEALAAGREEPGPPGTQRRPGRGPGVEIRVRDDGPGIPPELLERIWNPEITTKRRGTGLGLALVRQTIRAHDGEVEASNRPGGGAEFRVFLPREGPTRAGGETGGVSSLDDTPGGAATGVPPAKPDAGEGRTSERRPPAGG